MLDVIRTAGDIKTHVVGLALALRLVVRRRAECSVGAARGRRAYTISSQVSRLSFNSILLTVVANAVTSVVIPEPSRNRELVRGDQRHVGAGATAGASGVYERSLEERAVLAVEAARAGLEVGDRRGERAVACVCAASGEDPAALDESGLQKETGQYRAK